MATILSTFTEVLLADTRTRAGTVLLPPLSQIPYRMLSFKDVYGTFSNSTLTLSTNSGNTFEDSTTTVVLSNAYSFYNLYAASTKWVLMDGTQTLVQTISTLNVNSLNIGTGVGWIQLGPIQTVAVSSTQIFTDSLYANNISSFGLSTGQLSVSSINGNQPVYVSTLVSTTIGLTTFISTFIDVRELASTVTNLISTTFLQNALASTVANLGQAGYVSSASLLGLVSTPNLLNLLSTGNLGGLVSTPNLLNLVSTSYLQTQLVSTIAGLNSVAVTQVLAGTNITISPPTGIGAVTINASGGAPVNWSLYPAISSIALFSTNPRIINPIPDVQCVIQSGNLYIQDEFNTPGNINVGNINFFTSTSTESYSIANNSFLTGNVSSLGLLQFDGVGLKTGSLYLSSLYLGNLGGSIVGQLTTDSTASDVYWNGTSLTAGGGGGITTGNLVSTTSGLQTNFLGKQGYFSTLFLNMLPSSAPFWDSNFPIGGSDPEPNPLALDIFGSTRILKNLYIGSTTTIVGTSGIYAQTVSTNTTTAKRMNFSSLFVNNAPILVDSNGNFIATTQVF